MIRIINSIFASNTYILESEDKEKVLLVDCGDYEPIYNFIRARSIQGILLTHIHYDHIYGLPLLLKDYPDCPVYTNKNGIEALASSKINLSRYHGDPIEIIGKNIKDIATTSPDWEEDITIMYTSGHSPSSVSFLIGDKLFTGDSYIPGIPVVANLPGADKDRALQNYELLKKLGNQYSIFPGHM